MLKIACSALVSAGLTIVVRAELPTQAADRFVDSIGVCTHWNYADTAFGFAREGATQRLLQSGIRHVRDSLSEPIVELGKLGILASEDKSISEAIDAIKRANAAGPRIVAIEGPNEPDLFWKRFKRSYGGEGYEQGDAGIIAAVIAYQKALYAAAKADPATHALTIIGPGLGKTYGYDTKSPFGKGTLSDAVDRGNFHPYPGGNPFNPPFPYAGVEKYTWHGGHPSTNLDEHPYAFDVYAPPFAPKPMAATETGYSTFIDGPSEAAHAKYLPRLFCEYFRKGVQRTFSYEFLDEWNKPEDREANFGLIRYDLSSKPAFEALRRLIRLVEEPNARPDFETMSLPAEIEVKPAKDYWHEIALDDTSKKPWRRVPLAPPMPVTLKLARPAKHVEVFIPNDCDEVVKRIENTDRIDLGVPDRVMVVRLTF